MDKSPVMNYTRILFTFLVFSMLHPLQGQKIKLSFELEPGTSYKIVLNNSISFDQEIMGINYTTDTKISNELVTEIAGKSKDGGYHLKCNYSRMEFSLASPRLDLEMSSESSDTSNPMNIMMKSLIGKNFTRIVSAKDETTDITGLDELIMDELNNINLPLEQKGEFKEYFLQSFGENAIEEAFRQNSSFYPDNTISPGDEWYVNMITDSYGIPMHLILNIKFREKSRDHAIFIAEGILAAKSDKSDKDTNTSYSLEGTQVSEVRINLKTGLIDNNITTQFIKGTISIADPDSTGSIQIPMAIKSRSTREIINKF